MLLAFRFFAVISLCAPVMALADEIWIVTSLESTNEKTAYEINNLNTKCDTACRNYGTSLSPKRSCSIQGQSPTCFNGPARPKGDMQRANCCCICLEVKKSKLAESNGELDILNFEEAD